MINPFLLKITSFTLIILDSLMYPISFATRNTSAEVSSLTPFLWFKALEMVAGRKSSTSANIFYTHFHNQNHSL